ELGDELVGEARLEVELRRERRDPGLGEVADGAADELVLGREVEIHGAAMLADGGAISRAIVRAVELEPLNVADFERVAADRLDAGTWGYFAGGAGDELTLRENVSAFAR